MRLRDIIYTLVGNEQLKASTLLQLHTLFGTPVGSVALDRDFGLNNELVDLPLPVSQAEFSAEIIEKISTYIPEVRANEVKFTVDEDNAGMQAEVILEYVKN